MQLCVENNGVIYEISEMCSELSWQDKLNSGASVLEFTYLYDGELMIKNGDVVRLTNTSEKDGIFFGEVFRVSMGEDRRVKVKAYDQLRRGKSKDIIPLKGGQDDVVSVTQSMCRYLNLTAGDMPTGISYKVPKDKVKYQDTWIDVIYGLIGDTLLNTKTADNPQGEWYRLADVYGKIRLDNLRDLQLPLVLGDDSLAYGYSWEKSIDDEFYNVVKISWMDEKDGKAQTTQAADQDSVNRYGNLQYYEHVSDKSADAGKLQEKAKKLLQLYNHEKETIKLSCIGDHSVRAGCSIYGSIADIELDRRVIVKEVTHKYLPTHTMELEVIAQ